MTLPETLTALVGPLLADLNLELVEIQFRRESPGWVLRLIIDSENGITVDDCARVSREVGNLLEVENLIDHAYHLEVSSPGLDRPLRSIDDFRRFQGRMAMVTSSEPVSGRQLTVGRIDRVDNGAVFLTTDSGTVEIAMEKIAKARLEIEF